jgi:hypothetical protein
MGPKSPLQRIIWSSYFLCSLLLFSLPFSLLALLCYLIFFETPFLPPATLCSIRIFGIQFVSLLTISPFFLCSTSSFPFPFVPLQCPGLPGGTLVSMNRFSTLCGWLVQRQGWRVKGEYDRVSRRHGPGLTPDLTTRDLWRSRRWARGSGNFVYSSLWDFKSSFICRKILRHGIFPLYFPSERKVCCGFLSPLKIHRLGRVLNQQP